MPDLSDKEYSTLASRYSQPDYKLGDYAKPGYVEPTVLKPPEQPSRTFGGTAKDIGITALKGAMGVPEAAVGLADIPTGGRVGKFLEEKVGFRPKEAKDILSQYTSPAQKFAQEQVGQAKGFGDTLLTSLQYPSTIASSVGESLPAMGAGGVVGRGLGMIPKVAPYVAGALGEGVIGAGLSEEQIRQETLTGLTTPKQSAMAATSGALTGLINIIGGRFANKAGFADVDTMLAGGNVAPGVLQKNIAGRILAGGISEGLLEEAPQSAQEQIWQNAALDKPLMEGVPEATAQGLLAGAAMGGGVNVISQPPSAPPRKGAGPMESMIAGWTDMDTGQPSERRDAFVGAQTSPIETLPTQAEPTVVQPAQAEETQQNQGVETDTGLEPTSLGPQNKEEQANELSWRAREAEDAGFTEDAAELQAQADALYGEVEQEGSVTGPTPEPTTEIPAQTSDTTQQQESEGEKINVLAEKATAKAIQAREKGDVEGAEKFEAEAKAWRKTYKDRKYDSANEPDVLYSYAGIESKTRDAETLFAAEDMEREGKTTEEIRKETGWFKPEKGDGKWRYEINDKDATVSPDISAKLEASESVPLAEIFQHEGLYEAYPNLQLVEVSTDKGMLGASMEKKDNGRFVLKMAPEKVSKETILHEVQHSIQSMEEFARGGSPTAELKKYTKRAKSAEHQVQRFNEAMDLLEGTPDYDLVKANRDDFIAYHAEEGTLNHVKSLTKAFRDYNNLLGEIEARDVAERADLTPEQRKELPPYVSQGIKPEDQIVKGAGGVAAKAEKPATVAEKPSKTPSGAASKRVVGEIGREKILPLVESGLVTIVSKEEAASMVGEKFSGSEGFAYKGKAYLIAENIAKGEARPVLFHEVGHTYLPKLFKGKRWNNLVRAFDKHAGKDTPVGRAVDEAIARTKKAGTKAAHVPEENIMYYLSETANNKQTLYRQIMAYIKSALQDMGFDVSKHLHPDDIVLMVEGYINEVAKNVNDKTFTQKEAEQIYTKNYPGPAWGRRFKQFGAGILNVGDIGTDIHYSLDKLRWDVDQDVDVFGTVNNRLGKELTVFERLFGPSEKAIMAPGKLVKNKRLPARTIKAHDFGKELHRVIKSGEYKKLMEDKRTNKQIAAARTDLSAAEQKNMVTDLNALRGKGGILGNNAKAGRSIDFVLGTCQPTENCQVCYAAATMVRMSHVRKAFRNTLHILSDPIGFAEQVAKETKKIPINKMNFLRLLGSGDMTSSEQVDSFNHMAKLLDRPIQIFSRHHENLAKLKSTKNAPFIKMGSVDQTLIKEYGIKKLTENLEKRGIANAILYTDKSELADIKKLLDKDAVGLILSASEALHDTLPIETQKVSCPCDAGERTFHASCRQCALSQAGCFVSFADKGISPAGKIVLFGDKGSKGAYPIANFKSNPAWDSNQSYLEAFNFVIDASTKKINTHITAYNRFKNNTNGAKRKSILLSDLRFPGDITMLMDEGNPYKLRPNPTYQVIETKDVVGEAKAYIAELEAQKERSAEGTFYLPGGEIQPALAWKKWQRLADPGIMGEEGKQEVGGTPMFSVPKKKATDKITDSAAFKKWFGDSKVVDEDGEPLVVYHGTKQDFSEFNLDKSNWGKVIYVTKNPNIAAAEGGFLDPDRMKDVLPKEEIDRINSQGTRVMPLYVSMQNPATKEDAKAAVSATKTMHVGDQRTIDYLKGKGFDGVMSNQYEYIAFSPTQIKSIYNKGTFDETNPDIRYSVASTPEGKKGKTKPDEYTVNRSTAKTPSALRKLKSMGLETAKTADKYLGAISTRLANIAPELKERLRDLELAIGRGAKEDIEKITPLLKKASKMNRGDKQDWDLARKNSDKAKIDELVTKYKMQKEYAAYRKLLDILRAEARGVGLEFGYIEEYAPRRVKDYDGFLEAIGSKGRNKLERAFKLRATQLGINNLTEEMQMDIASNILFGNPTGLGGPSNLKKREIKKIPGELNQFYLDSDTALLNYIHSMRNTIEQRKFFGKVPKRISEAKQSMHQAMTALRKEEKKTNSSQKKIDTYTGRIREKRALVKAYASTRADYTENIAQFVIEQSAKGSLSPDQAETLTNILNARFHEGHMHKGMQAYKNITYLSTMGNTISAVTQLGDIPFSMYENGWIPGMKALGKALVRKSRITKKDLGIDRIAQEFADTETLSGAVNKTFKLVGLEFMDDIGKETMVNSALDKYESRAQSAPNKLANEIRVIFGNETAEVIRDLQAKEITPNVERLVYGKLLDYQPVAKSEQTEGHLKFGNAKVLYMLKSFTIKQFDIFRRESYNLIKNGNRAEKIKGMTNLVYLGALLVVANAGADEIKDLMLGRKTSMTDRFFDNLLKLAGVSKYAMWQGRREGYMTAAVKQVLPPLSHIDRLMKDALSMGDDKGFKSLQSIPVGGKFAYWWTNGKNASMDYQDERFRRYKKRLAKIADKVERKPAQKAKYFKEMSEYRRARKFQTKLNKNRRRQNKIKAEAETATKSQKKILSQRLKQLENNRIEMIENYLK